MYFPKTYEKIIKMQPIDKSYGKRLLDSGVVKESFVKEKEREFRLYFEQELKESRSGNIKR